MSAARLYNITKTLLNYGLDELIPSQKIPWYGKVSRACLFWLKNKHPEKTCGFKAALSTTAIRACVDQIWPNAIDST
ncbi:hypothetical protein KAN5_29480 [Pseudoalteromonas sp. KAN5]|nr:hypothetical protein KAN5_29480 [Pseudoalteromonas sp. KAN5]